ncbi:MAG: 4-phosphoerythronate dehydrogenase [Lentisphaeria bacterium]|nr:4-phosphoerythronate dehydrogenase [Lentisphaeria bacterium]
MKIIADDKIPFLRGVFEPYCQVEYLPGAGISRKTLQNADALITRTRTLCTPELLEGTAVKFIATATIGHDHISPELTIPWSNAPGCNSSSVAQYIISALLQLDEQPLEGRTIGIVGVGHVGSKVAAAAGALGMNVLLNDPPRQEKEGGKGFVPLDEVVERADFLTFHVPLKRDGKYPTYHLADKTLLNKMKEGAVLLNSSRGEVADTAALKEILRTGRIRAVLDVWENEPHIDRELLALTAFATPHIAGYSTDGKANGTAMAVRAVAGVLNMEELKDFKVNGLPQPPVPVISLPSGLSEKEAAKRAVTAAYDIRSDDSRLRQTPERFEELRGNYPLRREPCAFTVKNGPAFLRELGFILEDEAMLFWEDARITGEVSASGAELTNNSPDTVSCEVTVSPAVYRLRKVSGGNSDFVWLEKRRLTLRFRPQEKIQLEFLLH